MAPSRWLVLVPRRLRTQPWRHIGRVAVVLLGVLVAEMSRGFVLPTLPPNIFNTFHGTVVDVGVAVALFSVGRLVATLPLGYWADRRGSREVLAVAAVVAALGNMAYGLVTQFGPRTETGTGTEKSATALIGLSLCRFVIGCGSATLGVARSYLAEHSTVDQRTRYMSWSGLAQFIGFSLTPGLGGLLMNHMAWAGYILAGINGMLFFLFMFILESRHEALPPRHSLMSNNQGAVSLLRDDEDDKDNTNSVQVYGTEDELESDAEDAAPGLKINKNIGATKEKDIREKEPATSMDRNESALQLDDDAEDDNFIDDIEMEEIEPSQMEMQTETETETEILSQQPTEHSSQESILAEKQKKRELWIGFGVFMALNFVMRGVVANAETLGPITQQWLNAGDADAIEDSGLYFMILGLVGCVVFLLIDPITRRGVREPVLLCFGILCAAVGGIFLMDVVHGTSYALFTIGSFLIWSLASPISQTLTISCFSQMLGSKPQGQWIGWLTTAGSLSRIVFPVVAVAASQVVVYSINSCLCLVCVALVIGFARYQASHRRTSST